MFRRDRQTFLAFIDLSGSGIVHYGFSTSETGQQAGSPKSTLLGVMIEGGVQEHEAKEHDLPLVRQRRA